jgi:hypothetical protein
MVQTPRANVIKQIQWYGHFRLQYCRNFYDIEFTLEWQDIIAV